MRAFHGSKSFGIAAALAAVCGSMPAFDSARGQTQQVEKSTVDAPDRNGPAPGKGLNTGCPPKSDAHTKAVPDSTLGDADANGDGLVDYFMGEYDFVKGDKDLHVKCWCLNRPLQPNGHWGDYFTKEIVVTQQEHPPIIAVPAGDEAT
jgi:hypothetical protein